MTEYTSETANADRIAASRKAKDESENDGFQFCKALYEGAALAKKYGSRKTFAALQTMAVNFDHRLGVFTHTDFFGMIDRLENSQ